MNKTVVGRVVGVFGLRGWVKIEPLTDFAERFDPGAELFLNGEPHEVLDCQWHKQQVRVRLEGVATVEGAQALVGATVEADADEEFDLEDGEYLVADLLGLSVVDERGVTLGKVDEIMPAPAHDLLRVGETLIPMVGEFIRSIDFEAKRIEVRLIPGMHPGEAPDEAR
jgi:16S rRNA processing protein RimM